VFWEGVEKESEEEKMLIYYVVGQPLLLDCEASQSLINKHGVLLIPNFLSSLSNSFKNPLSLLCLTISFCAYICIYLPNNFKDHDNWI
jgi:hypothetical protein